MRLRDALDPVVDAAVDPSVADADVAASDVATDDAPVVLASPVDVEEVVVVVVVVVVEVTSLTLFTQFWKSNPLHAMAVIKYTRTCLVIR